MQNMLQRCEGSEVNRQNFQRALPILHASLHALLTGGGHALHRELPQTASHHCHGSELAAGPRVGAVGILSVQPVLGVTTHPPTVVCADQRHLHLDPSASCPDGGTSRLKKNKNQPEPLSSPLGLIGQNKVPAAAEAEGSSRERDTLQPVGSNRTESSFTHTPPP